MKNKEIIITRDTPCPFYKYKDAPEWVTNEKGVGVGLVFGETLRELQIIFLNDIINSGVFVNRKTEEVCVVGFSKPIKLNDMFEDYYKNHTLATKKIKKRGSTFSSSASSPLDENKTKNKTTNRRRRN